MKIREGFVLREVADSIIVVPTGKLVEEFHQMITLNATGKFIWELLEKEIEVDKIAQKLAEKYTLDIEKSKIDTQTFIEKLKNAKILEE